MLWADDLWAGWLRNLGCFANQEQVGGWRAQPVGSYVVNGGACGSGSHWEILFPGPTCHSVRACGRYGQTWNAISPDVACGRRRAGKRREDCPGGTRLGAREALDVRQRSASESVFLANDNRPGPPGVPAAQTVDAGVRRNFDFCRKGRRWTGMVAFAAATFCQAVWCPPNDQWAIREVRQCRVRFPTQRVCPHLPPVCLH